MFDRMHGGCYVYCRQLPARRIGRCWKFKLEEVDEWVRVGKAADEQGVDKGGGPGVPAEPSIASSNGHR